MSIQDEINRINNNVQATLQTIADTGVTVGTNSDALPAAAAALANEKANKSHTHSASEITLPYRLQGYNNGATGCVSDPNNALESGFYYVTAGDTNRPPFSQSSNKDYRLLVTSYGTTWLQQIATDFRCDDIFYRRKENNTWKPWVKIYPTANATTSAAGLLSATDKTKLDGLATVATSGSYDDLSNRPTILTIGTTASTAAAGNHSHSGYATSAQGTKADNALPKAGGTVTGNITLDNSASSQSGEPQLKWGTYSSNTPFIGFATDQSDGTFVLCSLKGTTYATGLAIGGGSGNLLWKGVKVATTSDIPSTSGLASTASPTFTGTPKAPTASAGTNTTQIATTAFVQAALASASGGSTVVTGTYTGDNASSRTISTGVSGTPKFVFISIMEYIQYMGPWFKMPGLTMAFGQTSGGTMRGRVNTSYGTVDGGFTVGNMDTYTYANNINVSTNYSGVSYKYVAVY